MKTAKRIGVCFTVWVSGLLAVIPSMGHAAGTLSFCSYGAPEGFDIAQYELASTIDANGLTIYDQLTTMKPGTTDLVPGLAESWQIDEKGLNYTFKLRKGVRFHETPWFKPTRELNADDVMFSFQRMMDKKHPGHAAARNGFVYWAGMDMSGLVKSLVKIDAMTVRFTLTRPEAPFLANMAIWPIGSIFSAEYADQLRAAGKLEQLNTQPVGTGPYVFKSYQKDAVLRFAAHPHHWRGAPKMDQLVFAITTDPDVRLQRLKAGECMAAHLKAESLPQVQADPNLKVVVNKPLQTNYLAPNTQRLPTSNRGFREALWLAIDKPGLIKGAYGGRHVPAVSFLPARMWSLDTALPERSNVERARELVKASGYDGRELTLMVTDTSVQRRVGELLQADWARVGIKVKVLAMEAGERTRRSAKGEHDILLYAWISDNADPDNFFTPNLSCAAVAGGSNKSRWCNAALDDLLAQARQTTDLARRTDLYRKAQRLVYDEVSVIPLSYPETFLALHMRVQGFVASPFDLADFRGVNLD